VSLNQIFAAVAILSAGVAHADISDAYRSARAVVNYDFAETSNLVKDKGTYCPAPLTAASCPAVDLAVLNGANATRSQNVLIFSGVNLARSVTPASKIFNVCKTTGAMTIEAVISNYETVIARSGLDADKRPQPLRIVSMSKDLTHRNFILGQFYDGGDEYQVGVRTSSNEPDTKSLGNSLQNPLISSTTAILVPNTNRRSVVRQKVVFTLNSAGVGRLYLSDLDGAMYLATENSTAFGNGAGVSFFSNWFNTAYLNLGNENLIDPAITNIINADGSTTSAATSNFNSKTSNGSNLAECGAACFDEPNRYWKGSFERVAIYCEEVPRDQILGAGTLNVISNIVPTAPVDIATASYADAATVKAQNIYTRLTGVKLAATDPVIQQMAPLVAQNMPVAAAAIATQSPQFVNTTVRDFAAKMSNRSETINVPLNDFIATFMGFARDDLNAQGLLTSDYFYMANTDPNINPRTGQADTAGKPQTGWPTAPVPSRLVDDVLMSNNHYDSLETGRYDLNKVLVKTRQKVLNVRAANVGGLQAVDLPDPAGVLTSRQWLKEHAIAGTNRRLVEFSLKEFLCTPIEMAADAGGPDDVVGIDIDRYPGGVNATYMNSCRACHTILDSFRPAFSEWTFGKGFAKNVNFTDDIPDDGDEDVLMGMKKDNKYPGVAFKYNKEADTDPSKVIYPDGRRTIDNKWVNHALTGSNKVNFQFDPAAVSGVGVKSFGSLLSKSPRFQRCMAERAFRQICKRDVQTTDSAFIQNAANEFAKSGFKLKALFQNIVVGDQCLGEASP
jgi:hypothetical protein